jgi:hypothetical protein
MYFFHYTIELKILKTIQKEFKKLPPLASDDFRNGWDDIVAQYAYGGEYYIMLYDEY